MKLDFSICTSLNLVWTIFYYFIKNWISPPAGFSSAPFIFNIFACQSKFWIKMKMQNVHQRIIDHVIYSLLVDSVNLLTPNWRKRQQEWDLDLEWEWAMVQWDLDNRVKREIIPILVEDILDLQKTRSTEKLISIF